MADYLDPELDQRIEVQMRVLKRNLDDGNLRRYLISGLKVAIGMIKEKNPEDLYPFLTNFAEKIKTVYGEDSVVYLEFIKATGIIELNSLGFKLEPLEFLRAVIINIDINYGGISDAIYSTIVQGAFEFVVKYPRIHLRKQLDNLTQSLDIDDLLKVRILSQLLTKISDWKHPEAINVHMSILEIIDQYNNNVNSEDEA